MPVGAPQGSSLVNAADLDGDGDVDLLFEGAIYLNQGGLSFSAAGVVPLVSWSPGNILNYLRLADVDGDGDVDVLDIRGFLYRNSGTGSFPAGETIPQLAYPIVVSDFDRDGDLDLVGYGPKILTNMTRQLSRGMPARPGRPASLELGAAPGTPWQLFASTGTASFQFPPLGLVRLDLAGLQLAFSGAIGASGLSTISGTVPATPGIVGATVHWQAVIYHPSGARLTGLETTTVAAF